MSSIQAALVAAGLARESQIETPECGVTVTRTKRKPSRRHGKSRDIRSLEWSHDQFGSLHVSTPFNMGAVTNDGPNAWAKLNVKHEPTSVSFGVTAKLADNVHVLVLNNGHMTAMEDEDVFPDFTVPVEYKTDQRYPSTKTGTNDRDIVLLRADGVFINYEVGLVGRRHDLFVTGQETYGGQVVVMDLDDAKTYPDLKFVEVDGRAVTVVPLYAENAYPDHENSAFYRQFLDILPGADKVLEYAYRKGAYIDDGVLELAEWDPEFLPVSEKQAAKGWMPAAITFFNLVIGWGFALTEEGKSVFIHFKDFITEGGAPVYTTDTFPAVRPMQGVHVKFKTEGGKHKATAVRIP